MAIFFSSKFSERILRVLQHKDEWQYDGLVYPSVGNKYVVDNLAVLPNVIDQKFKLEKVVQFRITKTLYDRKPNTHNSEAISVAEVDQFEQTDWIEPDGYIVWD